jgi:protein-disulfide isomerase
VDGRVVAKTPEGGYVRMGNPNAPIKLVEYGSRQLPPLRPSFANESVEPS